MPIIKPSSDLRNNYNEMIELSRKTNEPVYLTKNGKGDAVLLSMESYEELLKDHLMSLLQPAIDEALAGESRPWDEVFAELREEFGFEEV